MSELNRRKELQAQYKQLRPEAGQARDGVRDAGVGQLADVFGADGLDDGGRIALGGDGRLDRMADAADDYLFGDFVVVRWLRLILRECCAGRTGDRRRDRCRDGLVETEFHTPPVSSMEPGSLSRAG